jgi:hypothetical protein
VNVNGAVRPQRHVNLLSVRELLHNDRSFSQKRPEFARFIRAEIRDMQKMTLGLDNQRANAKRANAVLDSP